MKENIVEPNEGISTHPLSVWISEVNLYFL